MTDKLPAKLYFAFYSQKAHANICRRGDNNRTGICKYRLADGSGDVNCTAVYQCSVYSSPEEVLAKDYLFDDAVFVGIVDRCLQSFTS